MLFIVTVEREITKKGSRLNIKAQHGRLELLVCLGAGVLPRHLEEAAKVTLRPDEGHGGFFLSLQTLKCNAVYLFIHFLYSVCLELQSGTTSSYLMNHVDMSAFIHGIAKY